MNTRVVALDPIGRLGKGGFGCVYLAWWTTPGGLRQPVAVKVLNPFGMEHPEGPSRFRDEARVMSALIHPSTVRPIELLRVGGRLALMMDFVQGTTLRALRSTNDLPPRVVVATCADVADVLSWAYNTPHPLTGQVLRFLHRDIKPSNILFTSQGSTKVLDFGGARANIVRESKTCSHLLGTLKYTSQERINEGRDGPEADVYGLGVTLLDCLSQVEVNTGPLRPRGAARWVSRMLGGIGPQGWGEPQVSDLRALLERMLAFDPDERPSAGEVGRVLRRLATEVPGPTPFEHSLTLTQRGAFTPVLEPVEPELFSQIEVYSPEPSAGTEWDETVWIPVPRDEEPPDTAARGPDPLHTEDGWSTPVPRSAPRGAIAALLLALTAVTVPGHGDASAHHQGQPSHQPHLFDMRQALLAVAPIEAPYGAYNWTAPEPSTSPPPTPAPASSAATEPSQRVEKIFDPWTTPKSNPQIPSRQLPLDGASVLVGVAGHAVSLSIDGRPIGTVWSETPSALEAPRGVQRVRAERGIHSIERTLVFHDPSPFEYIWLDTLQAWRVQPAIPSDEVLREVNVMSAARGVIVSVDGQAIGEAPLQLRLPNRRLSITACDGKTCDTVKVRRRDAHAYFWDGEALTERSSGDER